MTAPNFFKSKQIESRLLIYRVTYTSTNATVRGLHITHLLNNFDNEAVLIISKRI